MTTTSDRPPVPIDRAGSIELGGWTIVGGGASHRLEVLWTPFATPAVRILLDGEVAQTLARPRGLKPIAVSAPIDLDGRSLVVYVETADGGVTLRCDAIYDGRSLTTAQPGEPPRSSAVHAERLAHRGHWLARDVVPLAIGAVSAAVVGSIERRFSVAGLVAAACIVAGDVGLYRGLVLSWPSPAARDRSAVPLAVRRAAMAGAWVAAAFGALCCGLLAASV